MKPAVHIKRAYEPQQKEDGFRVLVDRLWPRGLTKEEAAVDEWAKELAPSNELRKWFGHDPERWKEFQQRYKTELKENPAVKEFISAHKNKKHITLIYSAKDEAHNQAVVLKEYLAHAFSA
ncbi:DUF488 domain-containing protein [Chitinophaga sp. GCM10012297]|uniref:DUF488 domain-containing protein n=1 Tax=Chitinophaga chungangae TaxID=2821488 RepID=A0ABS3YK33_9BACT|nr:DUF488 domain-containing protein [Chitinophaga chungangae]MBO9154494.1 DUF488 domain-containing protein [Chitinophaga chungangae]